ncbi:hypothetical protein RRG08_037244 [Elysia crispata]|uniref:Reverse transcriptase domain-containing protein n=1 Tax=Elysia crispata TaxID=231223 RepID=A0AAE0YNH6_9GAST|nr:hypothetical protein RRG08_037244 [Elysia crispata]
MALFVVDTTNYRKPQFGRNRVRMRNRLRRISTTFLSWNRSDRTINKDNDLVNDLNGAMMFSKIDLKNGYHQLELSEDSKYMYITTFSTHAGIFQYNRLHFRINSASEIFQHQIENLIQGIQAKNYNDDIIIYGKFNTGNIEEATRDHDENLKKLLNRLKENHVTANADKCVFHKTHLKFHGYIFSKDGISADPEKVQALKDARPPENPKEVCSFLGMANYAVRFIPNFATISEPLRTLTHKNTTWKWTDEEENSFNKIKSNQLVIPRSLQHKCIDLAHEGHLGIMKAKQLIRQKFCFPGVDAMVEDKIKNCISCQSCT